MVGLSRLCFHLRRASVSVIAVEEEYEVSDVHANIGRMMMMTKIKTEQNWTGRTISSEDAML